VNLERRTNDRFGQAFSWSFTTLTDARSMSATAQERLTLADDGRPPAPVFDALWFVCGGE